MDADSDWMCHCAHLLALAEAPPGQPAPALTTAPMINLQATRGPMATSESPTAVDGEAVGLDTPRGAVLAETHSAESAGSAGSALGSVDGGAGVRAEVRAGASPGVVKGDETPPEAGMSPGGSTASWLMSTPSRVWRRVLSAVTPRRAANPGAWGGMQWWLLDMSHFRPGEVLREHSRVTSWGASFGSSMWYWTKLVIL